MGQTQHDLLLLVHTVTTTTTKPIHTVIASYTSVPSCMLRDQSSFKQEQQFNIYLMHRVQHHTEIQQRRKEVYAYHNEGNNLPDESLWQVATQTA